MQNENNQYHQLYKKLSIPWKDEENNTQLSLTRKRFLEIFLEVFNINTELDYSALHFFTLMELNIVKIIFKKKKFNENFLPYFTREKFLVDKSKLQFFIDYISYRRGRILIRSNFLKNQYQKIISAIIKKMKYYIKCRRNSTDPNKIVRRLIREQNLSKYFNWTIKIGKKFSNRYEFDYSNLYVMQSIQEHAIKREIHEKNKK